MNHQSWNITKIKDIDYECWRCTDVHLVEYKPLKFCICVCVKGKDVDENKIQQINEFYGTLDIAAGQQIKKFTESNYGKERNG